MKYLISTYVLNLDLSVSDICLLRKHRKILYVLRDLHTKIRRNMS